MTPKMLYGTVIFGGAFLIFWIEPLISKIMLPYLGGSSGVWLTAVFFFQTMLLLGYLYAHGLTRLAPGRQAVIHAGVVLLAMVPTPFRPEEILYQAEYPALAVIFFLGVSIGLPFFVLSSTAPLLQKWLTDRGEKDVYHLYSLSNAGSLGALLLFPFLLEPRFSLTTQSLAWKMVFILWAVGIFTVIAFSRKSPSGERAPIPARDRRGEFAYWTIFAFIPSSLLLGVTHHLTIDLAAVPLLWVVPLALYLLSFIIAFARSFRGHQQFVRLQPLLIIPIVIWIAADATAKVFPWLPHVLHLAAFFVIAVACHGEIARTRPEKSRLTAFYLALAVGGWLGGAFNALVAPVIFNQLFEYPLVLVLAAAFLPIEDRIFSRRFDIVFPVGIAVIFVALGKLLDLPKFDFEEKNFLLFGVPAILALFALRRPRAFALTIAALLFVAPLFRAGDTIHRERTFYGLYKIDREHRRAGTFHVLLHGTTLHGRQSTDSEYAGIPLTYYHPEGPVGDLYRSFATRDSESLVAAVGLGAGSIAAYAEPGRVIRFFEIDPAVERIARNPAYFTYLPNARGTIEVVLGDARISLARDTASYGLILLDAFSSDAIPVHLLTREAFAVYLDRLASDGMIGVHLSNRNLDLVPIVARLAAELDLVFYLRPDFPNPATSFRISSTWGAVARNTESLGPIARDPRWIRSGSHWNGELWTDDFSNIFTIFKWK